MARRTLSITLGLAALLAISTLAAAVEDKPGRYTMSPVEDGFVRLDTETGEMAFCKRESGGTWACVPMASRDAPKVDPGGPPAAALPGLAPPGEGPTGKIPIPSEEDVDRLFDYVEGMMKKLKERLKRLEEQDKPSTPL